MHGITVSSRRSSSSSSSELCHVQAMYSAPRSTVPAVSGVTTGAGATFFSPVAAAGEGAAAPSSRKRPRSPGIDGEARPRIAPPPPAHQALPAVARAVAHLHDPPVLLGVLREVFGFDDFRPGQREIVEALLDRQDVLVVMPTGAGKSLCYQLPATMLPGVGVVVSPLLALIQDQVESLWASPISVGAACLTSTTGAGVSRQVHECVTGAHERRRCCRCTLCMALTARDATGT